MLELSFCVLLARSNYLAHHRGTRREVTLFFRVSGIGIPSLSTQKIKTKHRHKKTDARITAGIYVNLLRRMVHEGCVTIADEVLMELGKPPQSQASWHLIYGARC